EGGERRATGQRDRWRGRRPAGARPRARGTDAARRGHGPVRRLGDLLRGRRRAQRGPPRAPLIAAARPVYAPAAPPDPARARVPLPWVVPTTRHERGRMIRTTPFHER